MYPSSYYAATANPHGTWPRLTESIRADVCGGGGGYTGLSAALNLAERDPHRLEEFFLYSHPAIARRIAHARQFRHGLT